MVLETRSSLTALFIFLILLPTEHLVNLPEGPRADYGEYTRIRNELVVINGSFDSEFPSGRNFRPHLQKIIGRPQRDQGLHWSFCDLEDDVIQVMWFELSKREPVRDPAEALLAEGHDDDLKEDKTQEASYEEAYPDAVVPDAPSSREYYEDYSNIPVSQQEPAPRQPQVQLSSTLGDISPGSTSGSATVVSDIQPVSQQGPAPRQPQVQQSSIPGDNLLQYILLPTERLVNLPEGPRADYGEYTRIRNELVAINASFESEFPSGRNFRPHLQKLIGRAQRGQDLHWSFRELEDDVVKVLWFELSKRVAADLPGVSTPASSTYDTLDQAEALLLEEDDELKEDKTQEASYEEVYPDAVVPDAPSSREYYEDYSNIQPETHQGPAVLQQQAQQSLIEGETGQGRSSGSSSGEHRIQPASHQEPALLQQQAQQREHRPVACMI